MSEESAPVSSSAGAPVGPPGKLEIHAALSALAAGESDGWVERARTVLSAFSELKTRAAFSADVQAVSRREDAPTTGHAEGLGDVTVRSDRTVEKRWTAGVPEERVGHFKVTKEGKGLLEFHHFWRADLSTEPRAEEHPPKYRLRYDEAALEPLAVETEETREVFRFGPLKVKALYAVPLLSVDPGAAPRRTALHFEIGNA